MQHLGEEVHRLSYEYFNEIRAFRHHLHKNPELSFQEYKTSEFICSQLEALQIPYQKNIAKTGVVGIIEGKNPSSKTVALRADMDALPINELNNSEYKSQNAGVMHACGHDVHTSCLIGAAKILNQLKDEFEGSIKLIFQPSEEKSPGGASIMIEQGVLENPNVQSIFGQHVFTPVEVGKVAFCYGNMMAACDEIYIAIKGKGGHGAYPHDTHDPVMMAAQMLVALQQVVSRSLPPLEPVVLTFGKVIANGATNIIPDEVHIEGTLRTMNEKVRSDAQILIERIAKSIVEGLKGTLDLKIVRGYPSLKNDMQLTQKAFNRAVAYLGKENVLETTGRMGAEDFAFYSQIIPACFYRLGTGNAAKGITSFIHTPTFDIDENAIPVGMGLMAWQAVAELSNV